MKDSLKERYLRYYANRIDLKMMRKIDSVNFYDVEEVLYEWKFKIQISMFDLSKWNQVQACYYYARLGATTQENFYEELKKYRNDAEERNKQCNKKILLATIIIFSVAKCTKNYSNRRA